MSAEGAKIEAPQAPRGWVREEVSPCRWGMGLEGAVPPPQNFFEFLK